MPSVFLQYPSCIQKLMRGRCEVEKVSEPDDNLYHLLKCNVTTSSGNDHAVDGLLMAVMKNG